MSPSDLSAKAQMREAIRGVRWDTTQQTPEEASRMRAYVGFAERQAGGAIPGMCPTCAFRPGTEANRTALVLEMIENCALGVGAFNCHYGAPVNPANGCIEEGSEPHRLCRGFAAFMGYLPRNSDATTTESTTSPSIDRGTDSDAIA